jgi:filamentous hemagglutinin
VYKFIKPHQLTKLDELGLPTVNAKRIQIDGKPAILMDRFELGSKDMVVTVNGLPRIIGESSLLNQRSIDDLTTIKRIMIEKNVWINDLQFLIGEKGNVVLADIIDVQNKAPSKTNMKTINRLIDAARKNL